MNDNNNNNNFEEFFKHYLIAALWSSTDTLLECTNCGQRYTNCEIDLCYMCKSPIPLEEVTVNLDNEHTIEDIGEDSINKLKKEALRFYEENKQFFNYKEHFKGDGTYSDAQLAGHDTWLSSHHHGCGFFDRDDLSNRDLLQERAGDMIEFILYIGDDYKIHLM